MKENTIPKIVNILQKDKCTHNDIFSLATYLLRIYIKNSVDIGIQQAVNNSGPTEDVIHDEETGEKIEVPPASGQELKDMEEAGIKDEVVDAPVADTPKKA